MPKQKRAGTAAWARVAGNRLPIQEPESQSPKSEEGSAVSGAKITALPTLSGGSPLTRSMGKGKGRGRGRRPPQWSGPLQEGPLPSEGWFPTDVAAAFAASVRLPHGTSLLVDGGWTAR